MRLNLAVRRPAPSDEADQAARIRAINRQVSSDVGWNTSTRSLRTIINKLRDDLETGR